MMNWGKEQKVDSLKTGKSYARLIIKTKAKRKLENQKNTVRGAADIKHTKYCEQIYANQEKLTGNNLSK